MSTSGGRRTRSAADVGAVAVVVAAVSPAQLAFVAAVLCFASLIQAVAAFGFGLLAVPLMTLTISPQRAVIISTLIGLLTTTWQAWYLRRGAERAVMRRMVFAAYLGMPLGLVALSTFGDDLLRALLGVSVLVAVILLSVRMRWTAGAGADCTAGFVSGLLNTSLSTNGPPLVFVLQARRMPAEQFRATIAAVFALSNVFALVLFAGTGKITVDGLRAAALGAPAVVVGQLVGFPLRKHVHGERFRRLVLGLLTIAGISAIAGALR